MTEGTAVLGDGEPAIKHLSYARARTCGWLHVPYEES